MFANAFLDGSAPQAAASSQQPTTLHCTASCISLVINAQHSLHGDHELSHLSATQHILSHQLRSYSPHDLFDPAQGSQHQTPRTKVITEQQAAGQQYPSLTDTVLYHQSQHGKQYFSSGISGGSFRLFTQPLTFAMA